MTYDIVLPAPKTQFDASMQCMNNMSAQWIGLSVFSKTINVKQIHDWEDISDCHQSSLDNDDRCIVCKKVQALNEK